MSDAQIRKNMEEQLTRLLNQLQDLESMKAELDEEEYASTKKDTLEQLDEFRKSLAKVSSGDMTLLDDFRRVQLAIRAAVSNAFQTPEVIRLFAKKAPGQLRERLAEVARDHKLGRLSKEDYTQQAVEILSALKRLEQEITDEEKIFLAENMTKAMRDFDNAKEATGAGAMETAHHQIKKAQQ